MEAAPGYQMKLANKTSLSKVCVFSYTIGEKQHPEDPSDFHCDSIAQLGKRKLFLGKRKLSKVLQHSKTAYLPAVLFFLPLNFHQSKGLNNRSKSNFQT